MVATVPKTKLPILQPTGYCWTRARPSPQRCRQAAHFATTSSGRRTHFSPATQCHFGRRCQPTHPTKLGSTCCTITAAIRSRYLQVSPSKVTIPQPPTTSIMKFFRTTKSSVCVSKVPNLPNFHVTTLWFKGWFTTEHILDDFLDMD